MYVFPYVGVNFRLNALGKLKGEYNGESGSFNLFDEDDMGDEACKRFQAGLQIGVAFGINRYVGSQLRPGLLGNHGRSQGGHAFHYGRY